MEKLTKQYILECLDKYCTFDELTGDNFENLIVHPLLNNKCFEDWSWDNGVTKGVLIFKGLDFVIKIPFSGAFLYTESHYEDSNGRWMYSDYTDFDREKVYKIESCEEFYEFSGADSVENNWNYCQVEAEISERAIKEKMDKCFAITKLIGYAKDYPIYAQERCSMFNEMSTSTKKEEYKNRTEEDYNSLRKVRERTGFWGIDNNWVLDFLIYWGEEMLKKLGDFMSDNDIEDLHCGNIGYHNGVPCLVDYSSYRE